MSDNLLTQTWTDETLLAMDQPMDQRYRASIALYQYFIGKFLSFL